jgi:PAS domain-containing protein
VIEDAVAAAQSERLDWSSDQFAAILRSVADGISVQDTSGRLRYANDPALELLGFASLDDLLSAPIEDVVGRFELFGSVLQMLFWVSSMRCCLAASGTVRSDTEPWPTLNTCGVDGVNGIV